MKIKVGDIVTASVSGIQPYGAFVNIDNQISGLIHISEISEGFVRDVHQFVDINDKVEVKVIDYDPVNKQARLSLKALKNSNRRDRMNMKNLKVDMPKLGFSSLAHALPIWIDEKIKKIEGETNETKS